MPRKIASEDTEIRLIAHGYDAEEFTICNALATVKRHFSDRLRHPNFYRGCDHHSGNDMTSCWLRARHPGHRGAGVSPAASSNPAQIVFSQNIISAHARRFLNATSGYEWLGENAGMRHLAALGAD